MHETMDSEETEASGVAMVHEPEHPLTRGIGLQGFQGDIQRFGGDRHPRRLGPPTSPGSPRTPR